MLLWDGLKVFICQKMAGIFILLCTQRNCCFFRLKMMFCKFTGITMKITSLKPLCSLGIFELGLYIKDRSSLYSSDLHIFVSLSIWLQGCWDARNSWSTACRGSSWSWGWRCYGINCKSTKNCQVIYIFSW